MQNAHLLNPKDEKVIGLQIGACICDKNEKVGLSRNFAVQEALNRDLVVIEHEDFFTTHLFLGSNKAKPAHQ